MTSLTWYNLARFDLVSVRLAVTCAQTGSLSAAARDSHLALAAASRRIKELESAVGEPLFERYARGMLVTASGRVFVKHALNLLQSLDHLGAELSDLRQGISRHVRLSASSAAIAQFLPPLLALHAGIYPQVRVELEEQVSEAVVTTLREGRCDVAVFVEGPDTTGLQTQLFRHDELVLVMPLSHHLAHIKEPISFAEALDEEWITLTSGAAMLQKQQQAALAANRPLKLRMQVLSFDAVCRMVASNLGIAVLPKGACLPIIKAMKLTWRPLKDGWAKRRLLVATTRHEPDIDAAQLVQLLTKSSQNAKASRHKKQ